MKNALSFWGELKRRNVVRAAMAYVVVSWVMLQVSDVILNNIEAPGWIFQVILLLLAISFPLVLIFAWIFELTPEGFKRDHEVERTASIAQDTGRQLDFVIIGFLTIALSYFAYDKFVLSPERDIVLIESVTSQASLAKKSVNSIAVLPFVNISPGIEQEYFSDGLSEELLNLLAKVPSLRVIARTSSFSFKGQNKKISEMSEELNVAHLLEGSVGKSGDTVRITARLVRGDDSSNIWSQSFDRKLDDIFKIQDEIAKAVVTQLKISLLGAVPTAQEANPKAYPLYLQARELSRRATAAGHQKAIELYQQALVIDPNYAAAWAGLADNYIFLSDRSLMPIDTGFAQARAAAEKALGIDPDNAQAHASIGWIAMVHDGQLQSAAEHLERALQLDPTSPQIIRPAATLSTNLLRLDEAIRLLEFGVARDPVSSPIHANLALSYFCAGQTKEAIATYQTAIILSPDAIGLHSFMGEALLAQNELEAGLAAMQLEQSEAWRLIGLTMAYHAMGRKAESDANLAQLVQTYGEEWPYNISYVLAYRGEADLAFEWLDKAMHYNDPGLSEIATAPEFFNVRSDPRWLPFLESIGKAPEQLAAIRFEVTLPD